MGIEALKEELQKLTKVEQTEVMHYMVELLAGDNFKLSDAWKKELDRRKASLDDESSIDQQARDVLNKYISKSK